MILTIDLLDLLAIIAFLVLVAILVHGPKRKQ